MATKWSIRFDDTLRFMKGRTNISFDTFHDESGLFSVADSFAFEGVSHENEDQQKFASQMRAYSDALKIGYFWGLCG